jgi:mannonate dehydratase
MANCHVDFSVSNFGIQEHAASWGEAVREVFSDTPVFADGHLTINDKAGLGIEINEAAARKYPYLQRSRPTIRRIDGTAWPY